MSAAQGQLFGPAAQLPEGFVYVENFIGEDEERMLLEAIARLPLEEAKYKEYTARRRIATFEDGMPEFLLPLRANIAAWIDVPADDLRHALVNAPRSGYRMEGTARWGWQHSIAATKALRYSITFRTMRKS